MKMLKLAGALAFAGLLTPLAANAVDGTITFNGQLLSVSCGVTAVTGGASGFVANSTGAGGNFTVTLPTISAATLQAANSSAGVTPFTMEITGCPQNGGIATAYFSGGNIDSTNGDLINNNTSGASNVELQLLNGDSSFINLANAQGAQGVTGVALDGSGDATIPLEVQYVSPTGNAGSGAVTSTVNYTIEYQ